MPVNCFHNATCQAWLKSTLLLAACSILSACQSWEPVGEESAQNKASQEIEAAIYGYEEPETAAQPTPPALSPALLPPLQVDVLTEQDQPRFDLSVDNLNARDFFMGLVQGTPFNMVVNHNIQGSITLELKDVTVEEVMQTVREVYGYEYKRHGRLYQVVPAILETAIFQIDYLHVQRAGNSDTLVSNGTLADVDSNDSDDSDSSNNSNNSSNSSSNNSNDSSSSGNRRVGSRITTTNNSDFWGQLQLTLQAIIGDEKGRRVVITPQAGVIVVRALPSELAVVSDYLQRAELTLQRQVILEAKILEVELSNSFQSGIEWSAFFRAGSGHDFTLTQGSTALSNPNGSNGIFGASFNLGDFTAAIQLLETQGNVQVLSSPRVSTLNNQKAIIKVGTDEFFVTDFETTTTTGTATTTTPSIELTPFFSGIALDVTPQISADGEIILHIHPSISQVNDQQKVITVGNQTVELPLAISTIRESDSVVRANSGQVIVIGGLMKSGSSDSQAKTPGVSDVTGVGALFKQKRQNSVKSELVILLKPTIANSDTWKRSLERSLDGFNSLNPTGSATVGDAF